jgi:hypothetical protein
MLRKLISAVTSTARKAVHYIRRTFKFAARLRRLYIEEVGGHHYLVSSTNKVYRVPTHITPDLINLYREARNQYRQEIGQLVEQLDQKGATAFIASSMDTDDLMERLGFGVAFVVEPIELEI